MVCERCQALEERVAYLERELAVRRDDYAKAAIMSRLNLTGAQAGIMMILYGAGGKIVNHGLLIDSLPRGGDGASVKVQISRIKDTLGDRVLTNTYGVGYALTPYGLSLALAALEPVEIQPSRSP